MIPLQQPITLAEVLAAGADGGGATITDAIWGGSAVGIAVGGTGQDTAADAFNALSPLLDLGDILYGGISGAGTRLAGNTSATQKFLSQTGTGSSSAAPVWSVIDTSVATLAQVLAAGNTSGANNLVIQDGMTNGSDPLVIGDVQSSTSLTGPVIDMALPTTFRDGITVTGQVGQVPVAINLASGQTAPALQITSFGGTAGDIWQCDAAGDTTQAGSLSAVLVSAGNYIARSDLQWIIGDGGVFFSSGNQIRWTNTGNFEGTPDVGLLRKSAGVLLITDGSSGYGALNSGTLTATGSGSTSATNAALFQNSAMAQILELRNDGRVSTAANILDSGTGQANFIYLNVGTALTFSASSEMYLTGSPINMNIGGGSGGGNILMDGGNILNLGGLTLNSGFPTSPGATGTVWNNLGILTVS